MPADPDRLLLLLSVSKSHTARLAPESTEELRRGKGRAFLTEIIFKNVKKSETLLLLGM